MKRILLSGILAVASFLVLSCEGEGVTPDIPVAQGAISVRIVGADPSTKADHYNPTAAGAERAVKSVQVLVFRDGVIDKYVNAGTSLTPSAIETTVGVKTVYVVLNAPSLAAIATEEALKATTEALSVNSTDASTGSFVMVGKNTVTVAADVTNDCPVTVKRRVCRLVIGSVQNNLISALGSITVKGVFVVNGGSDMPLDPTVTASTAAPAYNVAGRHSGSKITTTSDAPADLLMDATSYSVANGATGTTPAVLYAYPHTKTGSQALRATVLATIGGVDYYYPVTIPDPVANASYTCTLVITNLGSTDPNVEVTKGSATVTVTIAEWDTPEGSAFVKEI